MATQIDQDAELVVGDFFQINLTLDQSFLDLGAAADLTNGDWDIFYAVKASRNSQATSITKEIVGGVPAGITILTATTATIQVEKDDTEGVTEFDDITTPTNYFHSCKIVHTQPATDRPYTVFTGQLKISPQEVEENPPA